jgi:WD40 repeat protein
MEISDQDLFVRSGQGVYASLNEITWQKIHGPSNPLAVAVSQDETVLASGGADKTLRIFFSSSTDIDTSVTLTLDAPVICVAFAASSITQPSPNLLACGGMDGSAFLVQYAVENVAGRSTLRIVRHAVLPNKHTKYVKTLAWADARTLATASADGTVHLYHVESTGLDPLALVPTYHANLLESLHLETAVEALAFTRDRTLLCYARDTPHIACFDLQDNMKPSKVNLNLASARQGSGSGGFDQHVSLAVMDLHVDTTTSSQNHGCWLAATDTARNFILDPRSHRIVRNLYGHANDGYSQPKVAWATGSYVYGNTQDDSVVCVWDVASQKLVDKLAGHAAPVRDLASGPTSNMLVTTAFDKSTRLWYPQGL